MSSDSKSTVLQFLKTAGEGKMGEALALHGTEDLTWWVAGLGTLPREQLPGFFAKLETAMAEPMKMTLLDIIADGDSVAVEAEGYVRLKNSNVYNNRYHIKFVLRDGKIARIKEYHDTKHAFEAFPTDVIL